jgi:hypothetical protein
MLINRIKSHTGFVARFESRLVAVPVFGLGNATDVSACHPYALTRGAADVIVTVGRALLEPVKVLFRVSPVESEHLLAYHVGLVPASDWEPVGPELLSRARALSPRSPWMASTCSASTRWAKT